MLPKIDIYVCILILVMLCIEVSQLFFKLPISIIATILIGYFLFSYFINQIKYQFALNACAQAMIDDFKLERNTELEGLPRGHPCDSINYYFQGNFENEKIALMQFYYHSNNRTTFPWVVAILLKTPFEKTFSIGLFDNPTIRELQAIIPVSAETAEVLHKLLNKRKTVVTNEFLFCYLYQMDKNSKFVVSEILADLVAMSHILSIAANANNSFGILTGEDSLCYQEGPNKIEIPIYHWPDGSTLELMVPSIANWPKKTPEWAWARRTEIIARIDKDNPKWSLRRRTWDQLEDDVWGDFHTFFFWQKSIVTRTRGNKKFLGFNFSTETYCYITDTLKYSFVINVYPNYFCNGKSYSRTPENMLLTQKHEEKHIVAYDKLYHTFKPKFDTFLIEKVGVEKCKEQKALYQELLKVWGEALEKTNAEQGNHIDHAGEKKRFIDPKTCLEVISDKDIF